MDWLGPFSANNVLRGLRLFHLERAYPTASLDIGMTLPLTMVLLVPVPDTETAIAILTFA
jgi:hypothetical protein